MDYFILMRFQAKGRKSIVNEFSFGNSLAFSGETMGSFMDN